MNPAETLRRAAKLMRERAEAVTTIEWGTRPWGVEEGNCACIVSQGDRKPPEEPQVPFIHYIADAESPRHAEHIASWHPGVALAVAGWLDEEAANYDALTGETAAFVAGDAGGDPDPALVVARAYLGEGEPVVCPHGVPYGRACGLCDAEHALRPLTDQRRRAAERALCDAEHVCRSCPGCDCPGLLGCSCAPGASRHCECSWAATMARRTPT